MIIELMIDSIFVKISDVSFIFNGSMDDEQVLQAQTLIDIGPDPGGKFVGMNAVSESPAGPING